MAERGRKQIRGRRPDHDRGDVGFSRTSTGFRRHGTPMTSGGFRRGRPWRRARALPSTQISRFGEGGAEPPGSGRRAVAAADTVNVTVVTAGGTSRTSAADKFTYVPSTCGDGTLDPGEQCDDGNTISGDECSAQCQVESCFTCVGQPSVCSPAPAGSACDDDNACTVGETCNGSGVCGGFTSCRVNSTCNVCGLKCTQPQPGVCTCG
jgi:cysteine-rich repeat protein